MSDPATSPTDRPRVLAFGTLTRAHGIHGELRIRCAPDHVDVLRRALQERAPLVLRDKDGSSERPVVVTGVRGSDDAPIIRLEGVGDRTAAELVRGSRLCAERSMLGELEGDEYYLADLEGCVVHDAAGGGRIGVVARAEALPANVVLTIRLDEGVRDAERDLLAPLIDDAVSTIDVEARRIEVDCDFLGLEPAP